MVLSIIPKNNIYEFLGLSCKCSSEDLGNVAKQTYLIFSKKDKNNPVNVASLELAGICATISKDQKKRDAYDEYLKEKRLVLIKKEIRCIADVKNRLTKEQTSRYVRLIICKLCCTLEEAIMRLEDICGEKCFIDYPAEFCESAGRSGNEPEIMGKSVTDTCSISRSSEETDENNADAGKTELVKLPTVIKKQLEANLKTLNVLNIYDFLGVSFDCTQKELYEASCRMYSLRTKEPQSETKTASDTLCGICASISKNDDLRNAYNLYYEDWL